MPTVVLKLHFIHAMYLYCVNIKPLTNNYLMTILYHVVIFIINFVQIFDILQQHLKLIQLEESHCMHRFATAGFHQLNFEFAFKRT